MLTLAYLDSKINDHGVVEQWIEIITEHLGSSFFQNFQVCLSSCCVEQEHLKTTPVMNIFHYFLIN